MAFDGVKIGLSDGLAKHKGFFFFLAHLSGYPGSEPPAGAVQQGLLPGHRNHLDAPAGPAELLPKPAVGLAPGVQLRTGPHAGVDVDKYGRLRPHGNRRLEGEIMDQPLGMAGVDPAGQQIALDPEPLEAGDLLLLGRQPGQLQMVQHEVERQQSPPDYFKRGLPAVTDVGDLQHFVDLLAKDATDEPAVDDSFVGERPGRDPAIEQGFDASPDVEAVGSLQVEGELVSGEQTRVEADQGDPFGLLPREANNLQQFFPSLQVGNHGFPGLGHGVYMPAASSVLKAFSVSKRAVVL